MRRFSVKGRYEPLEAGEVVSARGRFRARFMAEELTQVFAHEHADDPGFLVGVGDGQFEVQVDGFPFLYVSANSHGRVWVDLAQRDQSVIIDEPTSFTTLDRPPPVSPEVRYMQQMVMANTRMREEMLNERRQIEREHRAFAETLASHGKGQTGLADGKEAKQKPKGGKADSQGPELSSGSEASDGSAVVVERGTDE